MATINMNCDCGYVYRDMPRDEDAPETATSMGCNWCPVCEDTAEDYYDEWYNFDEGGDYDEPGDPQQLMMFSIADEILNKAQSPENTPILQR